MTKKRLELHEILDDDPLKRPTRNTISGKSENGTSTTLVLGEMALGTKGCDARAYRGLSYFIEANGLEKQIGHVIMSGGLLPFIPTYYGIQNAREMVFLGNNWDQGVSERAELVFGKGVSEDDKKFIEKWVAYKITNTSQAVEEARRTMQPLVERLGDAKWHYLHGEEDSKNITALEEININNYIDAQKEQQEDIKKKASLEQDLENCRLQSAQYNLQSRLLRGARKGIHHSYDRKKVNEYLSGYLNEKATEIDSMEDSEGFRKLLSSINSRSNVTEKISKIDDAIKKSKADTRRKERELRDAINDINAKAREEEAHQFHRITKRRHIKPDEKEFLGYEAKQQYNGNLYAVLEGVDLLVHTGHGVDLVADGVLWGLAHKAKLASSSPGLADLKTTQNRIRQLSRTGNKVPMINATFHGAGGFRMEPINANEETIESYVHRETPTIAMAVQFPTMQSEDFLRQLWKKGVKNDHTRRWEKGNYAAGAVLYTVKDSGEHEAVMVTIPQLIDYCEIGDSIVRLRNERKNATTNGKKARRNKSIKTLEEKLKISPRKGTVITDVHFGSPGKEGRPSNYDVFEAAKKYLNQNGIPDVLVVNGDIVHGCLERHFGSNEQAYSRLPYQVRSKVDEIMASKKNGVEKMNDLDYLCTRELSHMNPIPVVSRQLREAKMRLVPLIHKVLDHGGHVIFTSGNHHNETTKFLDEATDLVNLLDIKYMDHPNVHEFVGFGEKYGMGETRIEQGFKIYASHGPMGGSDKIVGALRQLQGANRKPNLAVFGHVHQPGFGFGGGSYAIIGAGMQTWTPFVDKVGMQASLRGIVNFEFDHAHPGYLGASFVLDPTLERKEYKVKS